MQTLAYQQYISEVGTWLYRGRSALITALMARHDCIGPSLQVLEVGAGIGQNVAALATFGPVDVVEVSDLGLQKLRQLPEVQQVFGEAIPFHLSNRYDVIGAFDVIEHISDDKEAVFWMIDHLVPGGLFVATVPAYNWLYSKHDVALQHFRRYRLSSLIGLVPPSAEVIQSGYFNTALFPLAVASRITKLCPVPNDLSSQSNLVSRQSGRLPLFLDSTFGGILSIEVAAIRRGLNLPYGLSAYCVARRTTENCEDENSITEL